MINSKFAAWMITLQATSGRVERTSNRRNVRTNANDQILDRDGNVWPENGDPDNIDWIANEGIRTSRLVAFLKAAQVREHERVLQAQFIAISSGDAASQRLVSDRATEPITVKPIPAPPKPGPSTAEAPPREARPARLSGAAGNGLVSLTLPLTIHIGLGTPQEHATSAAAEVVLAPGGIPEDALVPWRTSQQRLEAFECHCPMILSVLQAD